MVCGQLTMAAGPMCELLCPLSLHNNMQKPTAVLGYASQIIY